ncbi:MAG: hypothetical protein M1819_005407 [Sarea resinae]|nr:MAG: hypothetical protein M1819_005407 [Sarea resinae]
MTEKKRKRASEKGDRPSKKTAIDDAAPIVKVSMVPEVDEWSPIVASTPGLSLPPSMTLHAYRKPRSNARPGSKSSISSSELLLHSSEHAKLDYTAREEDESSHLKHYVGIYDPKTGEIQVVEARKLTVRGKVREREAEQQKDAGKPTNQSLRNQLGMEFGTKKAKKAIASLSENAIADHTGGSPAKPAKADPLSAAILEIMAASMENMPTSAERQSQADEAKPRPKANLKATTPAEVYPIEVLVGGKEVMESLAVKEWLDSARQQKNIQTKSRFVSNRLTNIALAKDVPRLKVLRYTLLLIDFFMVLKSGKKGMKKLPPREELRKALGVSDNLIEGVRRRFADGSALNKWNMDNLYTHIAALALVVDNFEVDTYDLKEDLRLEPREIRQYFHEVGCHIKPPTEADRVKMKISKAEAAAHHLAQLRLPLDFPKVRVIRRR